MNFLFLSSAQKHNNLTLNNARSLPSLLTIQFILTLLATQVRATRTRRTANLPRSIFGKRAIHRVVGGVMHLLLAGCAAIVKREFVVVPGIFPAGLIELSPNDLYCEMGGMG